MGGWLVGQRARQHPDLTPDSRADAQRLDSALRVVILAFLAVDGVISAVLGAIFVQVHLGAWPFPVSALLSGLVNASLVWVGQQWTESGRVAAIGLWTWLLTLAALASWGAGGFLAASFGGFFDDIFFGGPGFDQYSFLVLLALGALPPALVVMRRR